MAGGKLTPMMAQYQRIRRSLPDDVLLFFRLGDFYELFFEDAKEAASILNVALTKRHDVPMCGVPHHAAQGYMAKLVTANKRVAIAEQTSEPQAGKIVEREVTQIISAGTIDDLTLLDDKKPNYLVSCFLIKNTWGLACVDHTTGQFTVAEFPDLEQMRDEIVRLRPSELLLPDGKFAEPDHPDFAALSSLTYAQPYDSYAFIQEEAESLLKENFHVSSLAGFGCENMPAAISAAGAILHYLKYQLRRNCSHLQGISVRETRDFVLIDAASQANLDLTDSKSGRAHSLLGALDATTTPMGARLLRDWILHPLRDRETLIQRQNIIAAFLDEPYLLSKTRESLKGVRDMERTLGRLSQGSGNARDVLALSTSLERLPGLKEDLKALPNDLIKEDGPSLISHIRESIHDFTELTATLTRAMSEEPPAGLKDGGLIADGYSSELDDLRDVARNGKQLIAELQEKERAATGIDSLKIKFNNVFGYFLEVTKTNVSKVPEHYQRKQTMANAERYITPELKELENKVLGSDERSKQLEYELFLELRNQVCEHLVALQQTSAALAQIDVLLGLAETAQRHNHVRPLLLDQSKELTIISGRHPVLEQTLIDEQFIPNDAQLDQDTNRLVILTGPNMAGKSTYIRQVALITLMAQIGAFVPADSATIGLVDRIFCRVGASDDLTKGHSTFMVEMTETALIVNNATEHSLVILDEIGRGTATFDGLSIAWAVAEHLHDTVGCRTLFATHYHELTDLATSEGYSAVANYHVAVREWNDDIIFLRQIVAGPADKSYGIAVAKLAGLPASILERANGILTELETHSAKPITEPTEHSPVVQEDSAPTAKPAKKAAKKKTPKANKAVSPSPQLDLF